MRNREILDVFGLRFSRRPIVWILIALGIVFVVVGLKLDPDPDPVSFVGLLFGLDMLPLGVAIILWIICLYIIWPLLGHRQKSKQPPTINRFQGRRHRPF